MSKTWLRIIAILEIIGGICGLIVLVGQFFTQAANVYVIIIVIVILNIYFLSIVAGITLLKRPRLGRILSIIVQLIQLPKIVSPLIIYSFSFGIDAYILWIFIAQLTNLGFNVRFLSDHQFFLNVPNAPIGIGVSIVSCIFLVMLFRASDLGQEQIPESDFVWDEEAVEQSIEKDTGKS